MTCNCSGSTQRQPRIVRSASDRTLEAPPETRTGGPGDGDDGGYYAAQRSQPRPKDWPPRQFRGQSHPDAARR